ncbi:unannotated protein [freshwater metagenome]|uniref:Unannotated protein n=1 Tax=freshwater metagenome TaxID=449393 RepID=A0A6J5YQC8_9ZZZZ|nr:hypothetical protein [Actinomycetota bacterium]MSW24035.1 hypothetical protein [Actinomycetota bacterium]MSX29308.1 hypothetical protein [Actinomycetota bacterium]MSX42955.1 hypothetical protein [Actinomycetota bacterium]MSX96830.1 hypothetical protein [Actinomycetota bacterium]
MTITNIEATEVTPASLGWTYPGVIILTSAAMMVVMALDVIFTGDIGLVSNIGLVVVCLISALKVRTADYQAAIWVAPIAWLVSLLTVGQLAPMRGGSFLREQVLHLAYGLAMHAWWILGATALSAGVSIFRRGRRP